MAHELDLTGQPGNGGGSHIRERVLNYGKSTPLTGVFTYSPQRFSKSSPCVVILNAGVVRKSGPNNLNAFLARQFAQQGFGAFRFDFAGVGDSPNRQDTLPLKQGVLQDVTESLDALESVVGARRFVLVGLCSGADNGLRAARLESRRVIGLAMMDPTVFRTRKWRLVKVAKRVASSEFWKSVVTLRHRMIRIVLDSMLSRTEAQEGAGQLVEEPELYSIGLQDRDEIEACLRDVRENGVALCFAFTGGWVELYNYRTQLYDVYPKLGLKGNVELLYFPAATHTFALAEHRHALAADLLSWLDGFKDKSDPAIDPSSGGQVRKPPLPKGATMVSGASAA
jgi:pimeloyl-ACP methyl ester carboxylesterase